MARELTPCRDLPGVKDVRVKGAIGVVEMGRIADIACVARAVRGRGIIIRPFGNVVYLTLSFTISANELTMLTIAVPKVVAAIR